MNEFEEKKASCTKHGIDFRLLCDECKDKHEYVNSILIEHLKKKSLIIAKNTFPNSFNI